MNSCELTDSMLGKSYSRWHFNMFFIIFLIKQDLNFHANCLLWLETICMNGQSLFYGKKKKENTNILLSSAELAQRVEKVKYD